MRSTNNQHVVFYLGLLVAALAITTTHAKLFWYLTDAHLDLQYVAQSDAQQLCHVFTNTTQQQPFGNYFCDAPLTLVQSALRFAASNFSNQFVIYAG